MKPQPYLTKEGKAIFKELTKHLTGAGILDIDTYRLSDLAQAMDMVARCTKEINNPTDKKQRDGVQQTPNGYTQVTGYVTVVDKYHKIADQLGAKYGLTPADREKIKAFADKEDEKPNPIATI